MPPICTPTADATSGHIIQCNQTLLRVTGYAEDEVVGRPVFELYHPDNIEAARKAFRPFPASGKVDNAKLQLRRKDGIKVYVMLNATAVYDGSGKIAYSRSSLRDITERKQAEIVELRQQRDFFCSNSLTLSRLRFSTRTWTGRYMGCNRAFESDTGIS